MLGMKAVDLGKGIDKKMDIYKDRISESYRN